MNFIHIAGHLGADPETRFTPSGKKVTTLRVATKSRKGGNDETIWWRVTIWGEQFDKMLTFLKKGSAIIVFGEMQKPEIFTDREGKQHISLEITASSIQFSPFGKSEKEGGTSSAASPVSHGMDHAVPVNPYLKASVPNNPQAPQGNTYDDEVPF